MICTRTKVIKERKKSILSRKNDQVIAVDGYFVCSVVRRLK